MPVSRLSATACSLLLFSLQQSLAFHLPTRITTATTTAGFQHRQQQRPSLALAAVSPADAQDILSLLDIHEHPLTTLLSSYVLVTASDMIPFVPCQPLAIALGAKLGFSYAFPLCSAGQTTAGLFAFTAARRAADSSLVQQQVLNKLDPQAIQKFDEFKRQTSQDEQDAKTILLGLIGLRLAPFFPFSAGNYLLGGATAVPLSLFFLATLLGCLLSNFVSTSVGAAGAITLWN